MGQTEKGRGEREQSVQTNVKEQGKNVKARDKVRKKETQGEHKKRDNRRQTGTD